MLHDNDKEVHVTTPHFLQNISIACQDAKLNTKVLPMGSFVAWVNESHLEVLKIIFSTKKVSPLVHSSSSAQ